MERLENCDPSVNAECKRSLDDFSEQLLTQLGDGDGNVEGTKSETEHDTSTHNLERNTKVSDENELSEKPSFKKENDDGVGFDSEETTGKISRLSHKDPVEKQDKDDSGDIPDVYFLSKYVCMH